MSRFVPKIEIARITGVTKGAITKASAQSFPGAVRGNMVDLDHPETRAYLLRRGIDPTKVGPSEQDSGPLPTDLRPVPSSLPAPPSNTRRTAAKLDAGPAKPARAARPPVALPPARAQPSDPPPRPATKPPEADAEQNGDLYATEEDISRYEDWTLRRLRMKFGTSIVFKSWLGACKAMVDIKEKELGFAKQTGALISRELVRTQVFAHIADAYTRLLGDTAPTLARRMYAMARSGAPIEDAEALARELIGATLATLKEQAVRALRDKTNNEAA